MILKQPYYLIVLDGVKLVFIGVDYSSGGYPYETEQINQAKFWETEDAARNYKDVFKKKVNWKIIKLTGLNVEYL